MKNLIITLASIFIACGSFAQKEKSFFFNEYSVSLNLLEYYKSLSGNNYGFGIGAYHSFHPEKRIHIISGLEYNKSRFFVKSVNSGLGYDTYDVTFSINSLSVPVAMRFSAGSRTKLFLEAGGFGEANVYTRGKGTTIVFSNHTTTASGTTANLPFFNYGLSAGIGLKIPVAGYEFSVKADYKAGLQELSDENEGVSIVNSYFRIMLGLKI